MDGLLLGGSLDVLDCRSIGRSCLSRSERWDECRRPNAIVGVSLGRDGRYGDIDSDSGWGGNSPHRHETVCERDRGTTSVARVALARVGGLVR